ncbi:MAG TPA: MBL fold metallo-hydrolase [Elusimicrobiales bacterium]|nr:MBL fold metallo-hydrolase [Elusimicrobiales bacterium]HOL62502.1 MBL fold metallo-hydrolase [Elusimicrobiales bacterium]HPO96037.1 MBL fold metallo-hydrolase [Elusimicrobiales bacterium]
MVIKFWGTRGSIPVCGKDFIKYGGNTTCLEIRDKKDDVLIVDCGTGVKNLGKEIIKKNIRKIHIVFTHQHWDHILGFPFFAPIYDEKNEIIITGCSYGTDDLRAIVSKIMQPPGFPVKFEEIDAKFKFVPMCREGCYINNIFILPIELSHPNGGLGYKFIEEGKTVVFLTDNELGYVHQGGRNLEDYVIFSKNADVLICDADYNEEEYKYRKTWGHSTYLQALDLAIKANVKTLYLFHHNQDRTDKDIEKTLKICRNILKKNKIKIKCFAAIEGEAIKV